ncbi:MAG: AraC family transcriptional regulator [Alphaproteobacteria bacterium]|nr:AraC family transcriptional regulator [Alphaproteobacteria bacterium]
MSELTVAAGLARGLMQFAVSKGANQDALLARAGVTLDDLQDQDNRVPYANYVKLMRAAKELTNNPALALHYGEFNDFADISIVGLITLAAETMLDAFTQINRFGGLVIEVDCERSRFELERDDKVIWLIDTRRCPNDFPELTESTFARMVAGGRRIGPATLIKEVHVTHDAPAYRAEYDRVFQLPVKFAVPRNRIALDYAWLTAKVALQPRYVFGVLSEHAEKLLKNLKASKTSRGRVESLLMPVLHTGDVSMDKVAETMALSRQTLFRKLKDEGTTFEKVLDELRHNMALHYLSGKKVSITETAYLVGFSEVAAFSRAFKRWTGKSPREMRKA